MTADHQNLIEHILDQKLTQQYNNICYNINYAFKHATQGGPRVPDTLKNTIGPWLAGNLAGTPVHF